MKLRYLVGLVFVAVLFGGCSLFLPSPEKLNTMLQQNSLSKTMYIKDDNTKAYDSAKNGREIRIFNRGYKITISNIKENRVLFIENEKEYWLNSYDLEKNKTFDLEISTTPSDAQVSISNGDFQSSKNKIRSLPKVFNIIVKKDGYFTEEREVYLSNNKYLNFDLKDDVNGKITYYTNQNKQPEYVNIDQKVFTKNDQELIAYYKFDGNLNDSSENSNYAKEYGDVKYHTGIDGESIILDGKSSAVKLSDKFEVDDDFTYSFFIKIVNSNNQKALTLLSIKEHIHSGKKGSTENSGVSIKIMTNDGSIKYNQVNEYNDKLESLESKGINLIDGKYHHIAIVKNGIRTSIYIDGKENVSKKMSNDLRYSNSHYHPGSFIGVSKLKCISCGDWCSGRGCKDFYYWYKGDIDEFKFYKRALKFNEVKNILKTNTTKTSIKKTNINEKKYSDKVSQIGKFEKEFNKKLNIEKRYPNYEYFKENDNTKIKVTIPYSNTSYEKIFTFTNIDKSKDEALKYLFTNNLFESNITLNVVHNKISIDKVISLENFLNKPTYELYLIAYNNLNSNYGTINQKYNYLEKAYISATTESIKRKIEELIYSSSIQSLSKLKEFVKKYPNSIYVDDAKRKIEEFIYISSTQSLLKLKEFVKKYPNSIYVDDAKRKIATIEAIEREKKQKLARESNLKQLKSNYGLSSCDSFSWSGGFNKNNQPDGKGYLSCSQKLKSGGFFSTGIFANVSIDVTLNNGIMKKGSVSSQIKKARSFWGMFYDKSSLVTKYFNSSSEFGSTYNNSVNGAIDSWNSKFGGSYSNSNYSSGYNSKSSSSSSQPSPKKGVAEVYKSGKYTIVKCTDGRKKEIYHDNHGKCTAKSAIGSYNCNWLINEEKKSCKN